MTEPGQVTLLVWSGTCGTCGGCADLLAIAGRHAEAMVGFAYAPSDVPRFFRLGADGKALDENDKPLPIGGAYEVRLFDDRRDIRGRRDGCRWRVAVVSDGSVAGGAADAVARAAGLTLSPHLPDCCTRDNRYLLWGRKARSTADRNGWTRLTAARIGALWVPHRLEHGCDGIEIAAREYFRIAQDGNVVLAGERLTGLRGIRRGDAETTEEAGHAG